MGLFDGLRQQASAQRQQWLQQLYATLPPGAPQVYVDDIPVRGPAEVAIAWYVGTVGLRSEDVYGFLPVQSNDVNVAITVIYRDRPEYAQGRARLAGP